MQDQTDVAIDDPPLLQDALNEGILAAQYEEARREGRSYFEVVVAVDEPLDVLAAWRRLGNVFYWADRRRRNMVVAAGVVEERRIETPSNLAKSARALQQLESSCIDGTRFYGGIRFDPLAEVSGEWSDFGSMRFFKPRYELRISRNRAVLRVSITDCDIKGDLATMSRPPRRVLEPLSFSREHDMPDRHGWADAVSTVLASIREGDLEKAVLARAVDLRTQQAFDAVEVFRKLVETTPSCYHIFFQPQPGAAFLSATPERLFARKGRTLKSEAVAGTRPRSTSSEHDLRLRDELFSSDKDRREHAVVGRSIVAALAPYASSVEIDELPSEMRLATGRHLKSMIRAELKQNVSSAALLEAIHPTPAVGGHPTERAIQMLRGIEPFDRGWYAGAIGWVGNDEAELAVGIRSALVNGHFVRLYSGAGIVEGSEANIEWDEIEQKIEGFLQVLGLTG